MLTSKQLQNLANPIISIYNELEMELLNELVARFDMNENLGGSAEWQVRKLMQMGVFNADCVKLIAKRSKKTEKEINDMLKKASLANYSQSEMDKANEAGLLRVTYTDLMESEDLARVVNYSFIDVNKTIKLVNTKCLESMNQAYMDVINKAVVETASGIRSYNESIARSLKEFAKEGIKGATYQRRDKDGNTHLVNYSLESVLRRDIVTACNSISNKASIDVAEASGYEYVEVSAHMGARVTKRYDHTNHAWWQGKVYKLHGSDPKYPNLIETTGYGLVDGLGGVNCRHRTFPFIPGISKPMAQIDYNENKKVYLAEQQLRKMERTMRELRRTFAVLKKFGQPQEVKKAKNDILSYSKKIDAYCAKNSLKRDENRETVKEFY